MSDYRPACKYNLSDDDCWRCRKHGFWFNCSGCEDYTPEEDILTVIVKTINETEELHNENG